LCHPEPQGCPANFDLIQSVLKEDSTSKRYKKPNEKNTPQDFQARLPIINWKIFLLVSGLLHNPQHELRRRILASEYIENGFRIFKNIGLDRF
jgi:hypothetical protein